MKANELRIGNLVGCDISTLTVKAIYDKTVICHKSNGMPYVLLLEDIYGLLLTEEWLVKFGFIEHEVVRCLYNKKHNGFEIDITIEDDNVLSVQLSSTNISGAYPNKELFKYVHQLQNLYFALTGEEFTIKE